MLDHLLFLFPYRYYPSILFYAFFSLSVNSILIGPFDSSSFSVAYENIDCIEYKKIVSVVHYKAYRYKSSIDEFIINYIWLPEFGYEEGVQKAIIKYCPHNNDMRCFFSFMKDKNPKIEFSSEKAGSDGIEKDDFDFFLVIKASASSLDFEQIKKELDYLFKKTLLEAVNEIEWRCFSFEETQRNC